jgi:hypothetical protein
MVRRSRSRTNPQHKKPSSKKLVSERGVYAVRRSVSPLSVDYIDCIISNLQPEMENASRLFDKDSLGVTIIGFSRFDDRHKRFGQPTHEIAKNVPSSSRETKVLLGRMGIYGSGAKHKLGFEIISSELETEVLDFEAEFKASGSKLRRDPNKPSSELNLHLCVGLMYEDHIGHFNDDQTLTRLGNVAMSGLDYLPVILNPISDK